MSSLPLLCALGWHRTDPLAQWNDGYYFARCKRCGHDLVRTAFGDWTVPRGYRVVWATDPPSGALPARLMLEGSETDVPSGFHKASATPINGAAPSHAARIAVARAPSDVDAEGGRGRPASSGEHDMDIASRRRVEFPIRDLVEVVPGVVAEDRLARRDARPDDRVDDQSIDATTETARTTPPERLVHERPVHDRTDGEHARRSRDGADDALLPIFLDRRDGRNTIELARPTQAEDAANGERAAVNGEPHAPSPTHGDGVRPDGEGKGPRMNGYDRTPTFLFPMRPLDDADASMNGADRDDADMDEDDDDTAGQNQDDPVARSSEPAPPSAPRYVVIPDFMDGGPIEIPYDLRTGEILPPGARSKPVPGRAVGPPRDPRPGWRDAVRGRMQSLAETGRKLARTRRVASEPPEALDARTAARPPTPTLLAGGTAEPEAVAPGNVPPAAPIPIGVSPATVDVPAAPKDGERSVDAQDFPRFDPVALRRGRPVKSASFVQRHAGLAAATVFGGFVLAAALIEDRPDDTTRLVLRLPSTAVERGMEAPRVAPRAAVRTVAAPTRAIGAPGDLAFVTASLLNCRSTPSDAGDTVRRLTRGATVQVLGADPGWVSVSHQGRQCWASARFISTTRPL